MARARLRDRTEATGSRLAAGGAVRSEPSRPPSPARGRRRWFKGASNYLFVLPAVVFVAATMIYPIIYVFDMSVHEVTLGNFLTGGAPLVGLENFADALGSATVWRSLGISLVYTGGSILLAVAIGMALALFFQRRFPGSTTLRALLLLTWVLPTVVTGTVWRWMLEGDSGIVNQVLSWLGLIDGPIFWLSNADTALISVIIATIWVSVPFAMVLLLAGLESIPRVLYEAARVDGAGAWQRFWRITLPMMRPVTLTVILLSFIFTFKTFDNVYVMTRGGPGEATYILPILAYDQSFRFFHFSEGATTTILLLAVAGVLAAVYAWVSRKEGSQ